MRCVFTKGQVLSVLTFSTGAEEFHTFVSQLAAVAVINRKHGKFKFPDMESIVHLWVKPDTLEVNV